MENKRLLVLGGTLSTYDVVMTAKKMGLYVIVADYLEDGVSKELADEKILISTTDIDGLAALVEEKKIDGVFTGASEFNIRNMIELCERCNLPVYASMEQWNLLSNKKKFKDTCRKYGVPVVPEYSVETEEEIAKVEYPVIVKPVDSFSGHGISICRTEEELRAGIEYAKENSRSNKIIVEKYVQGENVEVYYLVQDGEVMLMTASDRFTDNKQNGSPVPIAFYHPTKHLDLYLEETNECVKNMFQQLGVKNGVFFIESFLENGKFMFYEMGFRLNATQEYHFVEHFNGFSPLEMMISYAVNGTMGAPVIEKNEPHFSGKGCEIALLLKTGKIKKISGVEAVKEMPQFLQMIQFYEEGDVLETTGSLDQNFARIKVVADTEEELEKAIDLVYELIHVQDEEGREMLINERN